MRIGTCLLTASWDSATAIVVLFPHTALEDSNISPSHPATLWLGDILLGVMTISRSWALLSLTASARFCEAANLPDYGHGTLSKHTAQEIIAKLNLTANVEKGFYAQTFEDSAKVDNRSVSTAIYYLLEGADGPSYWHRVDAVEIWHYYAGAPLTLSLSNDDGNPVRQTVLGPAIFNGEQPQVAIQRMEWQHAQSLGDWTLVGTTGKHLCPWNALSSSPLNNTQQLRPALWRAVSSLRRRVGNPKAHSNARDM